MKKYSVMIVGAMASVFMTIVCFGADVKTAAKPTAQPVKAVQATKAQAAQPAVTQEASVPKGVKDMTKEEILKRITQLFEINPNLIKVVPGIESVKDEKGSIVYNYVTKDGKKTRLEDIDKDTLDLIYMKIQNEYNRISTEQTMKQMKEIRRIQELNRQTKALNRNPTTNTTTYKPVQLPKIPAKTYTAPKLPSSR